MYEISLPCKDENDMTLLRTFMILSCGFCILLFSGLNAFFNFIFCWLQVVLNQQFDCVRVITLLVNPYY